MAQGNAQVEKLLTGALEVAEELFDSAPSSTKFAQSVERLDAAVHALTASEGQRREVTTQQMDTARQLAVLLWVCARPACLQSTHCCQLR